MSFFQRSNASSNILIPYIHARRFDLSSKRQKNQNGHKKFKKGSNNVNPSRGVILCDIVARKKYETWYTDYVSKKPSQNDLSCSRFHGFRSKRRMLCVESRHSLFYGAHIVHACVYWDVEQCCGRKFSFSSLEKPFSIFRAQKDGLFCEAATKMQLQNATIPFL